MDSYEDHGTFMEDQATVQIVTFHKLEETQAEWADQIQIKHDDDTEKLRSALRNKGDPTRTWRWIHCEGLHGPTMKTIAKETRKSASILGLIRP